ncbi:MAG TPA: error-prone DNA polymerase [Microbacteriaceae bacterium]|nr:error-prone DNA polymerase [Microbacteriaceae bacterium]
MGWSNPPVPWHELERTLSAAGEPGAPDLARKRTRIGDGNDAPAWSRKRHPYQPPVDAEAPDVRATTPYVELHAHSAFSFLDGASSSEELVEEAVRLGLDGLALTDHDGFYGSVRFAEAAESFPELLTVYGAELSLELSRPQLGVADPEGSHLLVLARGQSGYHRLAGALTDGQLAGGEKGRPSYQLASVAEQGAGQFVVLTGCRKGGVRQALHSSTVRSTGVDAARTALRELLEHFGPDNVFVELFDHGHPGDDLDNAVLASLAAELSLPTVATGSVHYARPEGFQLAQAMAAVRARRSLDEMDGWLPAGPSSHLRSGAEMAARFARFPGAVERTVPLGTELAFTLRSARPRLPRQRVPEGHTEMTWLRELVWAGAAERYPGLPNGHRERLERELDVIEQKDFPGYFLIVHDIVREARRRGILCQGRGSAANSAVCYVLGITAVDSIFYGLPFERFLSSLRDEEPDIDVDFDSDRREEIIQYVYDTYGRRNAAQVANVITYRPRAAIRDMAKALGYRAGQQDAWSKQVERWGSLGSTPDHDIPDDVMNMASRILGFPRHLGIHSGGMVLTDRPVGEVCPIEHARKDGRTVLQWDKDDCAWMGLVKFDLLGLGMLAAIAHCFTLIAAHTGESWELATIPKEEPAVYDMLCRADSIGVFQVESRAQMGTLPRLQPRRFYELVVEIALIRPGPVQGEAVHPYIRRKTGKEPVSYAHPKLIPVLERTCGIPVFQEQIMMMAVAIADCTPADADLLRRAMGSKRGVERIAKLRDKLYTGMAANGLSPSECDAIYAKIQAFANFGFAESHAISFALLVYASAWLKLHYPAIFTAALLRAQPMGFYSPQTLTADARRHGVEVRRPHLERSGVDAGVEPLDERLAPDAHCPPTGLESCCAQHQPAVGLFDRSAPDESARHRRDGGFAIRLGLTDVAGIGADVAERIIRERTQGGPYRDMADLSRRADLDAAQLEALAASGACDHFGLDRRQALWLAGEVALDSERILPGTVVVVQPPLLPLLSPAEQVLYDVWATGLSPDDHPIRHVRERLTARGALSVAQLATKESGTRVWVGGAVTHRQRPSTAGGITFLNIEDETGLLNVVASVGVWQRYRRIARESPALLVRGLLERSEDGVVNLVADAFEPLPVESVQRSRDFR